MKLCAAASERAEVMDEIALGHAHVRRHEPCAPRRRRDGRPRLAVAVPERRASRHAHPAHGRVRQGLGAFSTPDYQPSAELPDAEYPLVMMTGRILYQYNACAMTARTDGVNEIANRSFIELNTCDAEALGIADGTSCASRRAAAPSSPSRMCPRRRRRDITWMPFHFQDGNSNWLTIAALDRVSKAPRIQGVRREGGRRREAVGEGSPSRPSCFISNSFQRRGALL